jgi:membrane protease YdiL (CAAX protease family)
VLFREVLPFVGALGRAWGYVLVTTFEWVVVAFIWYGVNRQEVSLSDLIGGSWARPVAVLRDLAIAVGFLVICGAGVLNGLGYLLKAAPNQAIRSMLPHGPTEIILYLMMALTAGFCEEVIFRGYLQRQLAALTQAAAGGIVLQGIAFGVSHGYQGWKFMLLIVVYGTLFGVLAQWRRSLRPGMITHFLQDGIGGLLARYLLR